MNTINNIPFTDYALHISTTKGVSDLPEAKEQFYTIYGKAGYQITKRRAKTLEIYGFIVAADFPDFIKRKNNLFELFSSAGVKTVNLGNGNIDVFCKEGFKITNVHILDKTYAKFFTKLHIV